MSHPFRRLRGNVRTPSIARWKAHGRLYIRRNWTFSLSPTVETLWAEIGRSWRFSEGWVTSSTDSRGNGALPTNHCWRQKTKVIAVSCGIKISAVHHLVLSQCTRLTDRQTELRQQYRALHYMQSHGKNLIIVSLMYHQQYSRECYNRRVADNMFHHLSQFFIDSVWIRSDTREQDCCTSITNILTCWAQVTRQVEINTQILVVKYMCELTVNNTIKLLSGAPASFLQQSVSIRHLSYK